MLPSSFTHILMISAFSLLPVAGIAAELDKQSVFDTVAPKKTKGTLSKIVIEDQKIEVPASTRESEPSSESSLLNCLLSEISLLSEEEKTKAVPDVLETKDDIDQYQISMLIKLNKIKDPVQQVKALLDDFQVAPKLSRNAHPEIRFAYDGLKAVFIREWLKKEEWIAERKKNNVDIPRILYCLNDLIENLDSYKSQLSQQMSKAAELRYLELYVFAEEYELEFFVREATRHCHSTEEFIARFNVLSKEKERLEQKMSQMESKIHLYSDINRASVLHAMACDKHNLLSLLYNFLSSHKTLMPMEQMNVFQQELKKLSKQAMEEGKKTGRLAQKIKDFPVQLEQQYLHHFDSILNQVDLERQMKELIDDLKRSRSLVLTYKNSPQAYVESIKKCIELQQQLLEISSARDSARKTSQNILIEDQAFYLKVLPLKRDYSDVDAVKAVIDLEKIVATQLSEEGSSTETLDVYKRLLLRLTSLNFIAMSPHFFIPFGQSEEGIKRARAIQEILKGVGLTFNDKVRFASFLSVVTGDESELRAVLEEKKAREKATQELLQESSSSTSKAKQKKAVKPTHKQTHNKTEQKSVVIQPVPAPAPLPTTSSDWGDEPKVAPKYQKTREERLAEHQTKAPKPEEVNIVAEDLRPLSLKNAPKKPETPLKLNSEIDLASIYNLKGNAAKLDLQIQHNDWNMSKGDVVSYLNALGCTIRSETTQSDAKKPVTARTGHGSHHVLSLNIADVLFKDKHLAYLIDEKDDAAAGSSSTKKSKPNQQESVPVFVLPQWQQNNVPYYIRERLTVIRNMLFNFKMEEEKTS